MVVGLTCTKIHEEITNLVSELTRGQCVLTQHTLDQGCAESLETRGSCRLETRLEEFSADSKLDSNFLPTRRNPALDTLNQPLIKSQNNLYRSWLLS
ncbi:hypothetical protein Ddc_08028 [Ditylenchus destructor]|nr:hypothetical protein Ddc_08028 [Ditylenchus destructor]